MILQTTQFSAILYRLIQTLLMKLSKKLFALICTLTLAASCNKNYTCECFSSGNEYELTSNSKAGADAECETYQDDPFNGNCELK